MREAWWIDVLEGELCDEKYRGVELLSKHSKTDEMIINNLKQVKALVKEQINEELPEDEAYYRSLHANVMNEVLKYEDKKIVEQKKKKKEARNKMAQIKTAKYYFSMGI
ncbi:MAG: hypothetical protein KDD58_03430 [Bdellovibrionales bacterium]|nr:hypothetical protein [Bdellovibrionales bacterium]